MAWRIRLMWHAATPPLRRRTCSSPAMWGLRQRSLGPVTVSSSPGRSTRPLGIGWTLGDPPLSHAVDSSSGRVFSPRHPW